MAPNVLIAYLDVRDVPERLDPLDRLGATVRRTHSVTTPEVRARLPQMDGLIVELNAVPAALLAELPHCRIIACSSTGFDYVAWPEAAQRGIWVTHVPDYCTEEAAAHTIALLLSHARQLPGLFEQVRLSDWSPLPVRPIRRVDRETLLRQADYVSLHTPLTDETRHMIDARALALVRRTAVLINTARGQLVDEAALLEAVRARRLAGAALDVLAVEPPPAGHLLLGEPRAWVTPHSAWCSKEADLDVWRRSAEDVARVLQGQAPLHAVCNLVQ